MGLREKLHDLAKTSVEHQADALREQSVDFYAALRAARLDDGRTLVDVSPDGVPVRTLKVQVP